MTLDVEMPHPDMPGMKQKGRVYVCDLAGTEPAGDIVYALYEKKVSGHFAALSFRRLTCNVLSFAYHHSHGLRCTLININVLYLIQCNLPQGSFAGPGPHYDFGRAYIFQVLF